MQNTKTEHNSITSMLKIDAWNNNKIWTVEQKQQIIDNIQQMQWSTMKQKILNPVKLQKNALNQKMKVVKEMVDKHILPEEQINYIIEALDKENWKCTQQKKNVRTE